MRELAATSPGTQLRPAVAADVDDCVTVYHRSMEALLASRHEPIPPRNGAPLARLFEHFVRTDPDGAWVAIEDDEIVGFAIAHRRGDRWFLAFLFVLEAWQGMGVGHALLERALPADADRPGLRLGVCAEAIQPVSTALYARSGMVPRAPIYLLAGRLRAGVLERDPTRLDPVPLTMLDDLPFEPGGSPPGPNALAGVTLVDREVLGVERPQDHAFWRATGRLGLLFRDPWHREGPPLGYGYVQPSGRLGPVVVRDPRLLPAALAELTDAVTPPDAWQAIVPGPAAEALVPLLRAGMRIEGGPAVYAADWDGPPFDRYLPMSFALI
jgi:GNAT superfamily N-acetyltransferase